MILLPRIKDKKELIRYIELGIKEYRLVYFLHDIIVKLEIRDNNIVYYDSLLAKGFSKYFANSPLYYAIEIPGQRPEYYLCPIVTAHDKAYLINKGIIIE